MAVNPMPLTVGEVLQKIKDAKSKTERVAILKENEGFALKHFLRLAFDPSVKMALAEGGLDYRRNPKPNGFGDTTIKGSINAWYAFFEKSAPGIRQKKRNMLFINLLESLDAQEAEFLIAAKDKKLEVGLTKKVIDEVFPGLLSESADVKPTIDKKANGSQTGTTQEAPRNN